MPWGPDTHNPRRSRLISFCDAPLVLLRDAERSCETSSRRRVNTAHVEGDLEARHAVISPDVNDPYPWTNDPIDQVALIGFGISSREGGDASERLTA